MSASTHTNPQAQAAHGETIPSSSVSQPLASSSSSSTDTTQHAETSDTPRPSGPSDPLQFTRAASHSSTHTPHPLPPLQTVKHSHFLDLSETEGVRTPRPATLTPSPPMRSAPLPLMSEDEEAGPSDRRAVSGTRGKGDNMRGASGKAKAGLPISVDEAVNGPFSGRLGFSPGSPVGEGVHAGSGTSNGGGDRDRTLATSSLAHSQGKQHLGGGLFGYSSALGISAEQQGGDIPNGTGQHEPSTSAGMDAEDEGQKRAISRTKSTRSVLGRGRGRVEPEEEGEAARLLRTIDFAARKHTCQRRKDLDQTPYINHPIAVANFLSSTGITDVSVMQAAVLHDTVEDTHTTIEEIAQHFGPTVARIVEECTDDQALSGQARKAAQIRTAGGKSRAAQQVKLADKLHNLESIRRCPPVGWTARRVQNYFVWAKQVTDICSPSHPPLAERLQRLYETAYTEIDGKYFPCHPEFCGPLTEEEKSRIDKRLQCLKKGEKPSPLPIFF